MSPHRTPIALALATTAGLAASALAQHTEQEPNETKAHANTNGALVVGHGSTITGVSTATSTTAASPGNADVFLLKSAPLAPGIYRNQLVVASSVAGHAASIRGLSQFNGVVGTADQTAQQTSTSTAPPRLSQWYGFGREEQVYYRVTGATATIHNYVATMSVQEVTPAAIPGSFAAGAITITTQNQGHISDTDLWVFDGGLNAIDGYGNDNSTGGATPLNSNLTRTFGAGTYYLAITNDNLAINFASPTDDNNRVGVRLDFADAVANSSTTTGVNVAFAITDSSGVPVQVAATKDGHYDIAWFSFTVAGPSVTGACCLPDGTCQVLTPIQCTVAEGTYLGDSAVCAGAGCDQGACCHIDGTCTVGTQASCAAQGGVYGGHLTNCGTTACPAPQACCLSDGTCQSVSPAHCATLGGTTRAGFACASAGCGTGACCLVDGSCAVTSGIACIDGMNGVYAGPGSACATANCPSIYFYGGGPVPIPDASCQAGAGAEIIVADSFVITSVDALFHITHVWHGDLSIDLVHVDTGTRVTLVDRPGQVNPGGLGFGTDDFGDGFFLPFPDFKYFRSTDKGPRRYNLPDVPSPGLHRPSGYWKPENPLSAFIGEHSGGTWRLEAFDCFPEISGEIRNFVLSLTGPGGPAPCYANCDGSTLAPVLNVADFTCFLQRFAAGEAYANCDQSTVAPVLNVADFTCFLQQFAAGCP